MIYETKLEIRPYPPIQIPRRELILPMPAVWFHKLNCDYVGTAMMGIIYGAGSDVREDIKAIFHSLGEYPIPMVGEESIVRASVPFREDELRDLEAAAAIAGSTVHELAIRILARRMWSEANGGYDKRPPAMPKPVATKPKRGRKPKTPPTVIPFPLELVRR